MLAQPALRLQVLDPSKFLFIVSDDGIPEDKRLSRDQLVIAADRLSGLLQLCSL